MLDRILVPLDHSPLAECTLGHALKLARAFGARVVLFCVSEPEPEGSESERAAWRSARADAQTYLSRMSRLFQEFDIPVDSQIPAGSPAEATLELAASADADLIMLSTHRSTGMTPFPLSGTASKVLAGATDSVMVVRSTDKGAPPIEAPYGKVLAAVDLTDHSHRSARVAATIATSEGSELLLVAVLPPPELLGDEPGPERVALAEQLAALNRESAAAYLEALRRDLTEGHEALAVNTRLVEERDVARALERLATSEDVSILVLGARGRSEDPDHRHGAVAARLLEQVDRPVLVYSQRPDPAARENR